MRKLLVVAFAIASLALQAQTNLQVQYDLGNGRKNFTSTLEMFKPDKWGDTFFFVDMEFNGGTEKQPSLAYMEIARCLKFWKAPLSLQLEYNGGLLISGTSGFPLNNSYLAGVDYGWHSKDFTKFLNFKALFKSIQGKNPASFQLTGVWNLNFLNKKLTVSGFADFWREDNMNFTNGRGDVLVVPTNTKYVFLTEPQIWYNATENLSLGGEVEIGTNFGTVDGWKVCPAIGAKWNF
jgi:hypothetical protein